METLTISRQQARRFILSYQGLWPPQQLAGKKGVLEIVRRLGCIQFDPLDVVGRNPDLVLQSRVMDYDCQLLQALLYEDRQLVDGWDKNMSILPVEDWPCFARPRAAARQNPGKSPGPVMAALDQVRQEIEARGPLSSIDLGLDQTVDWSWAPTRLARATLESMYAWGELIVHHKVHTRKVYDFAHRHIAQELLDAPDPNPTLEQYHDWYVLRRIGSVGLLWRRAGGAWLGIADFGSQEREAAFSRLLDREEIIELGIEGFSLPFYARRADLPQLEAMLTSDEPPAAAVIAPLDNLLWDRRLVEALFDFDYRWEVYTPAAKRRYGYYVLPLLYGDRFVARFEPKRNGENSVLEIKGWWWEEGVTPSEQMAPDLSRCLARFLRYLGLDRIAVGPSAASRDLGWLATVGKEQA